MVAYMKMGSFVGTIRMEHNSYKIYIPKEVAELVGAKGGDKVVVQVAIEEKKKR